MNSLFKDSFEKVASTAYSRHLAKKLFGKTPKAIAKAEYGIAKKVSGKSGRDAFRQIKGSVKKDSRGRTIKDISSGDALGLQPGKHLPKRQGDYASEIRAHKVKNSPAKGPKDSKGRLKGTISKDLRITRSRARERSVNERGVGDLSKGSAKEKLQRRAEQKKKYQESLSKEYKRKKDEEYRRRKGIKPATSKPAKTPEEIKAREERRKAYDRERSKKRNKDPEYRKKQKEYQKNRRANQTDAQKEKRRAKQRMENMTPEQQEKRRAQQREAARRARAKKKAEKEKKFGLDKTTEN